jgi:L-ascorbate metabolism protein UlaG (beta-lactamase superfamily)
MKIFLVISLIFILFFAVVILLGWIFSAPVYKGPVSDHFNGKKFLNPGNVKQPGFSDMLKWVRHREPGAWKEISEAVPSDPPDRVEGDRIVTTFVNHSTFLIQTMGKNILTDPVWSERASPVPFAGPRRMRPPGIRFEDLPEIDIILLTHNHYDHLDIKTLTRLVDKYHPKIYCPLGVGLYLERKGIGNVKEMDWWDSSEIDAGISVICTPAQHFSGRGMFDRDRTLWCGFALVTRKGSIYYSGDTGYGNFFGEIAEKISPIRLAFLPIGAYKPEWFMAPIHTSPSDALKIYHEIGSPKSIAMHFGTFPLADDGMEEAVAELEKLKSGGSEMENWFIALEEGGRVVIDHDQR